MQLPDARARETALDICQSFIVTAPAGSGKTELLVRRYLALLPTVTRPEEILCITFTRKAAQEMRQRIITALNNASTVEESHTEDIALLLAKKALTHAEKNNWHLEANPERLKIQTIDGFCFSLIKKLPLATQFGSAPNLTEQPEPLYELAIQRTLHLLESTTSIQKALATLISHLDNHLIKLNQLLLQLLNKRDQWLTHIHFSKDSNQVKQYLESVLQEIIIENLTKAHNYLNPDAIAIKKLITFAIENLQQNHEDHALFLLKNLSILPPKNETSLPQWHALIDFFLTQSNEWRKTVNKNQGFPPNASLATGENAKELFLQLCEKFSANDDLLTTLQIIRRLPNPQYPDKQWLLLDALTQILPMLVAQLKMVFREHETVDHQEIAMIALDTLSSNEHPSDLLLQIDEGLRHILIDEFQDTSPLQIAIISRLVSEWHPEEGRTLFLVGDALQSCYGFRSANVGLFLAAQRFGIGNIPLKNLTLQSNFRSEKSLVEWVNNTFARAFPQKADMTLGAIPYHPSFAFLENSGNNPVTCLARENTENQESVQDIIEIILHHKKSNPKDSIAVLVRNRRHLDAILPALNEANIAWHGHEIDSLYDQPVVQDFIILLRAMLNFADRVAWLSLLRTPWLGLPLNDIYYLSNYGHFQQTIWTSLHDAALQKQLNEDSRERLQIVLPILSNAFARKQKQRLTTWIYDLWCTLASHCIYNEIEMQYVEKLLSHLQPFDVVGDIEDIDQWIASLSKISAKTNTPGSSDVHVMTLHKAKGLEFDIVIIPELDRIPRVDDHQLLLWHERVDQSGKSQLLLSPISPIYEETDVLYQFIRHEQKLKQQLETTRLLYIGITRAIKCVYLLASVKKNKKNHWQIPDPRSLLFPIWDTFQQEMQIKESITAGTRIMSATQPSLKRLQLSELKKLPKPIFSNMQALHAENFSIKRITQIKTGTVIHTTLKKLAQENNVSTQTLDRGYDQFWRNQLIQLGIIIGLEKLIDTIRTLLTRMLETPQGQWILANSHRESIAEYPLISFEQGEVKRYVVDRTFIDKDDSRWIIEYKTAFPDDDQHIEAFIEEQLMLHQKQLQNYYRVFHSRENRPIRIAIYFVAITKLVEIESFIK